MKTNNTVSIKEENSSYHLSKQNTHINENFNSPTNMNISIIKKQNSPIDKSILRRQKEKESYMRMNSSSFLNNSTNKKSFNEDPFFLNRNSTSEKFKLDSKYRNLKISHNM